MFFKILVPLDGSVHSEAALKSASFMARAFNAELKLVTVEEIPLPIYPGETASQLLMENRGDEANYLQARAHELREQGCSVTTAVLPPGPPAQRILEQVHKDRSDLIVIGSHGRSGMTRILLGSVAERLAREAPCPVMINRLQEVAATTN